MSKAKQRGEYPTNWDDIARLVKRDADYQCVRCGHDHDVESGYVLTVHHFDGNKSNNERWNLMALCQRCHLSIQARVDPNQGILFSPSWWSMPYLAGWYRSKGLFYHLEHLYDLVGEYESTIGPWPGWAPQPVAVDVDRPREGV